MNARNIYYKHFAQRLAERYGLIATNRLYNDIIRQIQNTNQVTRCIQVNRQRTIHCVFINGKRVYVVYRKGGNGALVTALPPSNKLYQAHEKQKKMAQPIFDMSKVWPEMERMNRGEIPINIEYLKELVECSDDTLINSVEFDIGLECESCGNAPVWEDCPECRVTKQADCFMCDGDGGFFACPHCDDEGELSYST